MVRHETHQTYIVGPLVKTRFSGWTLAALVIAGLLVVPIVSVLSSLTPAGEVWRHLWRTQLVESLPTRCSYWPGWVVARSWWVRTGVACGVPSFSGPRLL